MRDDRARAKRLLFWGLGVIAVGLTVCVGSGLLLHEPLPEGTPGPEADGLARSFEAAVDREAWDRTRALRWTFAGRNHHLWDRDRELVRVAWDDVVVLLPLGGGPAHVTRGGVRLTGEPATDLREEAYARFINDSFWLNPLAKLFDEGVTRALVPLEGGGHGLLITYGSGGLTPGDSYLWIPGADGLPRAWKMWVSILPIGGVETSWERWQTLATGARVATLHQGGVLSLELTDVAGAPSLEALLAGEPDPFAALSTGR